MIVNSEQHVDWTNSPTRSVKVTLVFCSVKWINWHKNIRKCSFFFQMVTRDDLYCVVLVWLLLQCWNNLEFDRLVDGPSHWVSEVIVCFLVLLNIVIQNFASGINKVCRDFDRVSLDFVLYPCSWVLVNRFFPRLPLQTEASCSATAEEEVVRRC